jgi:Ulp1 protease family, C-terminal catalytic domain
MKVQTRKRTIKSNKLNNVNKSNKSISYKKHYKRFNKRGAGNKTLKLKRLNCSPKPKEELNGFSCYTNKSLTKLRDLWNARHPDVKITTNSPKEIHHELAEKLKGVCNQESCWLKQKTEFGPVSSELSDSFAPESPSEWKKNPNEWLSSIDIMNVMKQYEKAYKCFDFIGPTPIDFDTRKLYGECVWDELCNFSIEDQIKKGKTKIGIIFNTDPHNKPGQHWISMFINIKKKKIFFFDSTGDKPMPEIIKLVDRIKEQGLNMNPKLVIKFDSNEGVEHQYGNTECGIYSLFFIVHMLEDKMTDHYIKTHILKDEYMEKFRHVYFNDSL